MLDRLKLAFGIVYASLRNPRGYSNVKVVNGRIEIIDMTKDGQSFCSDCPDHEGCMQGAPCSLVKRVNSAF